MAIRISISKLGQAIFAVSGGARSVGIGRIIASLADKSGKSGGNVLVLGVSLDLGKADGIMALRNDNGLENGSQITIGGNLPIRESVPQLRMRNNKKNMIGTPTKTQTIGGDMNRSIGAYGYDASYDLRSSGGASLASYGEP